MSHRPATALLLLALIALVVGCGSPAPSPSPSPTSVQPQPDPKLVEFVGHVVEAESFEGRLIQSLAEGSGGSQAQLGVAARQMADWANAEIDWLDQHPADACYQVAADEFRTGVETILAAAAAFTKLATAPSPPTDTQGQAAAKDLAAGRSNMDNAAGQAKALRAECSA